MIDHSRPRAIGAGIVLLLAMAAACSRDAGKGADSARGDSAAAGATATTNAACAPDNGGLTLPEGFCASVFADSIGHARHMAVAPDGEVYVNTWSGKYYSADEGKTRDGGFVVALRDTNRDGRADVVRRIGTDAKAGSSGGTGIALYNGYLYAEDGARIVRYRVDSAGGAGATARDSNAAAAKPEVVVDGFPTSGDHPQHNFVIDAKGTLFANMGSMTNACQRANRKEGSPGIDPCTETATRAGIWRFDANKTGQRFSSAARYATGIRNAVGLAFDRGGQLYATQHGRDQLRENWPAKYTEQQGQELPSEVMLKIEDKGNYGWPYCYWDPTQEKLVTAPEYGGDGKQTTRCEGAKGAAAVFPAHWAPNDLLFYTGSAFPDRYRTGAFVAFHGSWNRAPGPQGGYQVAFVPMDGDKGGKYETFADGFAGGSAKMQPTSAEHRPSGLAMGPDGALYISDDQTGKIWRVTRR